MSHSQRLGSPGGRLKREDGLERLRQRRRGRGVTLGHPHRERVEHGVGRIGRVGGGRRGAGGLGYLEQNARTVQIGGPDCRAEGLEMGFAGQTRVQWLQSPGRADEQARGIADAALIEGDHAPQVLALGSLQRRHRTGLGCAQQLQRRFERSGVAFGPSRREQPAYADGRVRRERRCALEESRGCGDASPCLRAGGRALQLLGDSLVGCGCRLGTVPRAPVGIDLGIGDCRQGRVKRVPVGRSRRAIRRQRTSG